MRLKKNNAGLSLMELVVAIAILSIIGGIIFGFLSTSTNSYKKVSQDVDLQEEAQFAMNQLESLLMNAENGVYYEASSGELYIYNEKNCYVISRDASDSTLLNYAVKNRQTDASGAYTNTFDAPTDEGLMAEYVKDVSYTIDDSSSNIVVDVSMDLEKASKTYHTSQKITLRNSSLKLSNDPNVIYTEGTVSSVVLTPTYYGITVKLGSNKFSVGGSNSCSWTLTDDVTEVTLPITVTILGNNSPSQDYEVTLTGSRDSGNNPVSSATKSAVTISPQEEASALTLDVISSASPSLKCSVTINVKKITGISIAEGVGLNRDTAFRLGADVTLGATSACQLYAEVSGQGNLSNNDLAFTWEAGQNCSIDGNTLTITTDESAVGEAFSFSARSKAAPEKVVTYTGTVLPRNTTLSLTADSGTIDRGGTVQLTATSDTGLEVYTSRDVTYSYTVSGGNISQGAITLDEDGKLSAATFLDYNTAYTVTVTAALAYKPDVTQSVDITVPAVSVRFAQSQNGSYSENITVPMRNLTAEEGKNTYTIYYQIEGLKDGRLTDITWNDEYFGATTKVGDSSITFKKTDQDFDGTYDNYNYSWFSSVEGVPNVGGTSISASKIVVNNNRDNTNIWLAGQNYYIPVGETNGTAQLVGTDVEYSIEYVTIEDPYNPYSYYLMTVSAPSSVANKKYRAWNTRSGWEELFY